MLNQLMISSFKNMYLDKQKVFKIAKYLKRSELKQYIKALIAQEKAITVRIVLPQEIKQQNKVLFSKIFEDKKLIFDADPSLIIGLKVVNNDLVYDLSLLNTLKNLASYISSAYD